MGGLINPCYEVAHPENTHVSAVKLRDHPRLKHRGVPNWPPVWMQGRINGAKKASGEIGVLIYVYAAADSHKCYLVIEYETRVTPALSFLTTQDFVTKLPIFCGSTLEAQ